MTISHLAVMQSSSTLPSSTGALSDGDLATARADVLATLSIAVDIERRVSGVYTTVSSTVCSINQDTKQVTIPGINTAQSPYGWVVALPWDANVLVGDLLIALGITYYVLRIDAEGIQNTGIMAYCYQRTDSFGNVLVAPVVNATITLTRGNNTAAATGYTNRRVRIVWSSGLMAIVPLGQPMQAVLYDVPSSIYIQNDKVTVLSMDGHTIPPTPAVFTVRWAEQVSDDGVPQTVVQLVGATP